MAVTPGSDRPLGWQAADFTLPATDGRRYRLADLAGPHGLVVAFICNHCPYVKASIDRFVADAAELEGHGIGVVAVCSNDAAAYPADSFDRMKDFAREHGFAFPYLQDETQEAARAYQAQCTPDFFGFNGDLALQYRGRLDRLRTETDSPEPVRRELLEAMRLVAETGRGPDEQLPSIGCSIKWRTG
ncbi:MAG TPA: thioredoxin family protein [Afifellaceae bacterium]|nr:thioredoxin family protein [Afifellaceae bacterium]